MICGPTGCRRYSNAVTTPKLPPPPRRPQSRSGFSSSLARTTAPSAVTTSAASRLSHAGPWRRAIQPRPPPSVRPAMPVFETLPVGVARPIRCVAASISPSTTPGPARAIRCSGSTEIAFIPDRSITMPSSHTALPETLWPPPRTATGRPRSRANARALATSPGPPQRAISAGRRSTVPFQTRRARSYAAWSGPISSPANSPSSASVSSSTAHPVGRFARPYPRPRAPGKTA